jgi:hypothetical protein
MPAKSDPLGSWFAGGEAALLSMGLLLGGGTL